jgi:hypothetical protein
LINQIKRKKEKLAAWIFLHNTKNPTVKNSGIFLWFLHF